MISLRHVEFDGEYPISEGFEDYPAPKGIGELTCPRTWPTFVVSEESGAGIEELKSLNQLSGHIHIKGLHNIRNGACAREASLKAKQYLSALELSWSHVDRVADIEENSEKVIQNLEPHPNLKKLIVNRVGWDAIELPTSPSSLMELLEVSVMPNLERWSPQEADGDEAPREAYDGRVVFPRLMKLKLKQCPRIVHFPHLLPSLKILSGFQRSDLLLSLPDGGLQHHQQQSPPLNPLEMLRNLTFLRIDGCPKHAESLTSLAWLMIWNCPGISSLPESMGDLTSLTMLWISDCPGLSSLPESMGDLTSLKILGISKCPEITTLPDGLQRLTDLQHLLISGCPILKTRLRCNEGQDWHKVAHVPYIKIDYQDLRDSLSSVGHPSLMDSLKMGCNMFNTKKLLLPSCCSSSPSSCSTSRPT
ncbi:hypothetical protein MRB53_015675 [Persea americana]|uniref:Uncharacterized protein n=1 Tax=Persea americana TaxID=3435 RepID=A0ACC2LZQ2_PERAE|nr:hypothetical protein MRB53_015675 [Persea americana]